MAVVHKGEATLFWEGVASCIKGVLYSVHALFVILALYLVLGMNVNLTLLIIVVVFWKIMKYYIGKGKAFFHGSMGEYKVLQEFKNLPNEYHLFVGVRVHERMESDLVIVGPSGVFLVEIKNYVGNIEGTASDSHWILRKGRKHAKKLDNPLRQQKRNRFIVSQYLRMEGCSVWVESCTLFPNVNTTWSDGIPERCHRFAGTIMNGIREQEKKRKLPREIMQKAVDALDKCVYDYPPMTEEEFEREVQQQKEKQAKEHSN